MTQFAARYRAARAYAGLSQDELAAALGVDTQTVKRREGGKQEPKKAELIAVAAICDVPLEFMENGWGRMTADELGSLVARQNDLLREQSGILRQIKHAIAEQRALKDETDELMPHVRALLEGRPQEDQQDRPQEPAPTDTAGTSRAAASGTRERP